MTTPEVDTLRARVAELERERAEVERLREGMELAWGVIANAGGGDWDTQHPTWKQAAIRWRDEHWHTSLERRAALAGLPASEGSPQTPRKLDEPVETKEESVSQNNMRVGVGRDARVDYEGIEEREALRAHDRALAERVREACATEAGAAVRSNAESAVVVAAVRALNLDALLEEP